MLSEFELARVRCASATSAVATLPDVIALQSESAFVVGSTVDKSDVCLNHPCLPRFVSRAHAEFGPRDDGGHYVLDKGSTNGTFVNHQRLTPQTRRSLQLGDCLTFGEGAVTMFNTEVTAFTTVMNCYAYVYQQRDAGAELETTERNAGIYRI